MSDQNIQAGLSIAREALGRPLALQRSASIAKLTEALAKAQQAFKPIEMRGVNPAFRRDGKPLHYATLQDVIEGTRSALNANGIALLQFPADSENPKRIGIITLLSHSSGEYLESRYTFPLGSDLAHGTGSAITYAKRYAMCAILNVAGDEDDDGNEASNVPAVAPRTTEKPTAPQKAQTPAPSPSKPTQAEIVVKAFEKAEVELSDALLTNIVHRPALVIDIAKFTNDELRRCMYYAQHGEIAPKGATVTRDETTKSYVITSVGNNTTEEGSI